MKRFLSATTAIALSLAIAPRPAVGNPAALAAPAACATGVGCVVVGSVVVGGVLYYIWRNQGSGQEYRVPAANMPTLDDPDEQMERMGNNASQGRVVRARSVSEAHSKCARWADGRNVDTPERIGPESFRCRYS